MRNLFYVFLSIILGVTGQLLIKYGLSKMGGAIQGQVGEIARGIVFALRNPFVVLGFISYFLSAASWLIVLSRVDLSYAYPMVSLGFVFVLIGSRFVPPVEAFGLARILGTLIICAGVVLVARS